MHAISIGKKRKSRVMDMSLFTCSINRVGSATGNFAQSFLDPRSDVNQLVLLTMTDVNNTFSAQNFVVSTDTVANQVLAVALAAVNNSFQVLADVDWPPPAPVTDQGGNTYNPAPTCYSLVMNVG
jgi:hypothetical protein